MNYSNFSPRLVALELTRNCNLDCIHCRASASRGPYQGELETEEIFRILKEIAEVSKPVLILTGGEPLLRNDLFDIIQKAKFMGFNPVLATNGTLLTQEIALELKRSGISRVSISLDGASSKSHDSFRGVSGAFENALKGIKILKEVGVPFQINTTVTPLNLEELPHIYELAKKIEASAYHIFVLVPVGRGKNFREEKNFSEKLEKVLTWFYHQRKSSNLSFKVTCAPFYYRIIREKAKEEGLLVKVETFGLEALTRGCLAGIGFCFISHVGKVQPCGYLEITAGDLRKNEFKEIWEKSPVFNNLRNFKLYKGKCGICEYIKFCGGCRARAYELTGDYLEEEPLCLYQPQKSYLFQTLKL